MEEFNNEESLENREPVRCPVKEIIVLDSKIKQQATEISSKVKTGKTISFISLGLSVIESVISILTFSSTYQPLFS